MNRIEIPLGWKNLEGFGIESEFVFQRSGTIKTPLEMMVVIENAWEEVTEIGPGPTRLVDCGFTGCAFETTHPNIYLKATQDKDEFALCQMFLETPNNGFVPIINCHKLTPDLFLIWKSRLEATGRRSLQWLELHLGADIDALKEGARLLSRGYNSAQVRGAKISSFKEIISKIRNSGPFFRPIADLLDELADKNLAIGDTHLNNIGVLWRGENCRLVIFDGELEHLQSTCRICHSKHHFSGCMRLLQRNTGLSWDTIYQELDALFRQTKGISLIEAYTFPHHIPTKQDIIDDWDYDQIADYSIFRAYIWKKAGIA